MSAAVPGHQAEAEASQCPQRLPADNGTGAGVPKIMCRVLKRLPRMGVCATSVDAVCWHMAT